MFNTIPCGLSFSFVSSSHEYTIGFNELSSQADPGVCVIATTAAPRSFAKCAASTVSFVFPP